MSDFLKVVQAVKAGNSALAIWQKLEPAERLAKLKPFPELLSQAQTQIAAELSREANAPNFPTLDLLQSIDVAKRVLDCSEEIQTSSEISYLPVGLVGLLTGSRNPFSSSVARILSALSLGNSVIWQPSFKVERTIAKLVELTFSQLELPEGLISILPAAKSEPDKEISQGMIDHPGIHQLMFVGSTVNGKDVYSRAAQAGKRIQLSMGARNPAIIFADIDLQKNMEVITQSFFDFHGLGRWRASRIFVQESIYKTFLNDLKAYLQRDNLSYLGDLNSKDKEKFESNFSQAIIEKGKSLLDLDPKQINPRVVFDLTNCSTLQQDEINGPLITVSSFKYQFDALKYANTSPLGKAAYVWSNDVEKAKKVARKLEVGRVFVNELPKTFIPDRYIGAKESGFGAEGVKDLLEFCSHRINVT